MITTITTRRTLQSVSDIASEKAQVASQVPENTIAEVVNQENTNKWTYEEGVIKLILPLNDRVEVAVEPIFHPNREDTTFMSTFSKPMYYNTQFMPKYNKEEYRSIPFLQCFIPLMNFDASTGQDINTLIDRHVRVKVWDNLYASEAELLSWSKYERAYRSGISVVDMFFAEKHDLEAGQYLKNLGYSDGQIEEYLELSLNDVLPEDKDKGVIRLPGEAYWDKDVLEMTDWDIPVEKWPESLRRNAQAMKDRLCHMPIIMFTGR